MIESDTPLHPDFYATFNDINKSLLVEAISRAAETASESFFAGAGRGSNNKIFGYNFYEYIKFEFENLANSYPDTFKMIKRGGWVGLKIGRFELGFYRIGQSERDDVSKSFPANRCGAPRVVQLDLFENEEPNLTYAEKFILGYMLNPDDGLCAVYVGVPKRDFDSDRIQDWAHVEKIWQIDRDAAILPEGNIVIEERPAVEFVKEASLKKKPKSNETMRIDGPISS